MQRTRPVRTSLIAQPLPRDGRKPAPPPSKRAIRDALRKTAYVPYYPTYALKVLASIMVHGSETARIAAAKVLLQRRYSQPTRDEKAADVVTEVIIDYVCDEDEPPLAEGDYDTSICDPEPAADEIFPKPQERRFMVFGDD